MSFLVTLQTPAFLRAIRELHCWPAALFILNFQDCAYIAINKEHHPLLIEHFSKRNVTMFASLKSAIEYFAFVIVGLGAVSALAISAVV